MPFKGFKTHVPVHRIVKKWKQVLSQAFRSHVYRMISKFHPLNRPNVDRSQIWIIFPLLFLPKHLYCYNPGTIKPWMETCIYVAETARTLTIHVEILNMSCIFQRRKCAFNIAQFWGIFYIFRVIPSSLNLYLNSGTYDIILHVPKILPLSGTEMELQASHSPDSGWGDMMDPMPRSRTWCQVRVSCLQMSITAIDLMLLMFSLFSFLSANIYLNGNQKSTTVSSGIWVIWTVKSLYLNELNIGQLVSIQLDSLYWKLRESESRPCGIRRAYVPWWARGWESACEGRGHEFHPWSRKVPRAAEQLRLCATTTEPMYLEPVLCNRRSRQEKPCITTQSSPACHN